MAAGAGRNLLRYSSYYGVRSKFSIKKLEKIKTCYKIIGKERAEHRGC